MRIIQVIGISKISIRMKMRIPIIKIGKKSIIKINLFKVFDFEIYKMAKRGNKIKLSPGKALIVEEYIEGWPISIL